MESEHPSFSFPLEYAGATLTCVVTMQDNSYDVSFDGRWVASVEHTEDWDWIQASGVILPDEVIDEIGLRIESEYN